jgi:signal transduction histidine kinase/CHASE2 domain-containing sensor protein
VLSSKLNIQHLSRTAWARVLGIGILLLLAAFSWHPMGASMSGAFDKVVFDTATRWFAHPASDRVAVILVDDRTPGEYSTDKWASRTTALLQHLSEAASITLDYRLPVDTDADEVAKAIASNGHVVVPFASTASDAQPSGLDAAAAGLGQRHITLGHYGVVTGFVPYLAQANGTDPNIVLEAIRVAGMMHLHERSHVHLRSYRLSQAPQQTHAVLVMLGDPAAMAQYSFTDVADGKIPADAFAGRLVFVGNAPGDEAGFQISSLNMEAVPRAQLDALIADAVISGNLASELPGTVAVPIYLAIALGMVLICTLLPGRWMHLAALGWFVWMFVFQMLLLGVMHRWLGVGLLPFVCVFIYAYFAWERLHRTQNLLKREIDKLRMVTATVGMADKQLTEPYASESHSDPLQRVRKAMREIRRLQSTFVSMVNQLPYPVFVVVDNKVSVWNARAADLMTSGDAHRSHGAASLGYVQQLVQRHCRGEESASAEVKFGGREHMLLYVPYANVDASLHAGVAEGRASFLVCLIDIANIKEGVTHDKMALRHIAHDLRSPLSTILSLIEERTEGHRGETSHDRAFLEDLRRQADYSLRVAKDFLQLSRAEQISRDAFAPMALLDIATEAIDQLWPAAEAKSIELIGPECDLDDTLLMGNADMLIRALVNVIDNALKYSLAHTSITLRIVDEGEDGMVLHIVDQGIGIAEEDLPHLFDPFFQVGGGKADGDMGVGLGLPFVKTVIERHGGSITVASRLGSGTDFRMVLPRI